MESSAAKRMTSVLWSGSKMDDAPCSEKCRSVIHGEDIFAIGSQGEFVSDEGLLCRWGKTCLNFAHVRDCLGRSALHSAAGTGRVKVIEWLIKREGSNINTKDCGGYTPLHTSLFFGQISAARSLIKLGADLHAKDHEGLTPFDLLLADRAYPGMSYNVMSNPTELYIWGTNDNYNLGTETQQCRLAPETLEKFGRMDNSRICNVQLQTFHSVFLSQTGSAYVCGFGLGGRLGLNDESSVLSPKQLPFKSEEKCVDIAAGTDHTLFLMSNGRVRSCGSNENGVLGHPEPKMLYPKIISSLAKVEIKGVVASRIHSVFFTDQRMYTCGTNCGQLGHPIEIGTQVLIPKIVTLKVLNQNELCTKITHVAANEVTTVIRNEMNNVYMLTNFDCRRVYVKQFDVQKIEVIGGDDHPKDKNVSLSPDTPLTLFILTTTGRIFIWRDLAPSTSEGDFSAVVFNASRALDIVDMSVTKSSLLFVTITGEAYKCGWNSSGKPQQQMNLFARTRKSYTAELPGFSLTGPTRKGGRKDNNVMFTYLEFFKSKRVPNIYSGIKVYSDPRANTFAIIQRHPKCDLIELPVSDPSSFRRDLEKLFMEMNLDDGLCDVVFQLDQNNFIGAHRFVVASTCPSLYKLVQDAERSDDDVADQSAYRVTHVKVTDIKYWIFRQILQYLYTDACPLLVPGQFVLEAVCDECPEGNSNWMRIASVFARKRGIESLAKRLEKLTLASDGIVRVKQDHSKATRVSDASRKLKFDKTSHKNLSDITLLTTDKQEIRAHRCVLSARSDYFESMLAANVWLESTSMKPMPLGFSSGAAQVLLDYLYTDESVGLPTLEYEVLMEVLVMADQFLLTRLVTLVESAFVDLIQIKNVAEILQFAATYNASQLFQSCTQFVILNLPQLMESRNLDRIPLEIMEKVTRTFRSRSSLRERRIRPYTSAPHVDLYESTGDVDIFEQLENIEDDDAVLRKSKAKRTSGLVKRSRTKSQSEGETTEFPTHLAAMSPKPVPQYNTVSEGSPWDLPCSEFEEEPECSANYCENNHFKVKTGSRTRSHVPLPVMPKTVNTLENTTKSARKPDTVSETVRKSGVKPIVGACAQIDVMEFPTLGAKCDIVSSPPRDYPESDKKPVSTQKKKTKWRTFSESSTTEEAAVAAVPIKSKFGTSERDPMNPWTRNGGSVWKTPVCVSSNDASVQFQDILKDEQEKKENLQKAIAKPLSLMLIEEEAMNDLTFRYTTMDVKNSVELLVVERVSAVKFADPMWVTTVNK